LGERMKDEIRRIKTDKPPVSIEMRIAATDGN